MRLSRLRLCVVVVALLVFWGGETWLRAQLTAGSVVGAVKDPSGAVAPGAQTTIRNTSTGATYETTSTAQGTFAFPVVPVGDYTFTAKLAGFKTATGNLSVELNAPTSLSIVLEVGQVSESVEVAAAAAPVETTSTQIRETFASRQVADVPAASVSVNRLALLAPNTVDINTTGLTRGQLLNQVSTPVGGAIGAIGGNRARNNSFLLDGVDNNDPINTGPQGQVIQDAVQEFSLLKNNFDAEYGQFAGGIFNVITRTGTNRVHGNAFWYGQNRNLNASDTLAQNAIASGTLKEKPRFDYNRVGASVGGPVLRDRLFYFGSYQYETVGAASTSTRFVFPTQPGYDLLASLPPGRTKSGATAQVSPFVVNFLKQFGLVAPSPLPAASFPVVLGTPIPVGSASRTLPTFSTAHAFIINSDWLPGPKDNLHFRFNFARGPNGVRLGFPSDRLNVNRQIDNRLVSLTEVHTFNGRVLNELRLAYHRQVTANSPADPVLPSVPTVGVAEIPLIIAPQLEVPGGSLNNIYQLADNLSWQKGRHLLKFGTDLRNNIVTDVGQVAPRGDYRYVNLEDLVIDNPPTQSGQRGLGPTGRVLSNYGLNFFAQDQFRWSPRLTFYLGIRYEFISLMRDLATQAQESIADVPGVIAFRKPEVDHNAWSPRLGFAWDVFGDGRTSLRGGYGLNYTTIFGAFVGGGDLPAALQQVFFTDCLTNNSCAIPVPSSRFLERGGIPNQLVPFTSPTQARPGIGSLAPDLVRPYVQTFTLSLERELGKGWVASARFLRTKGTHLSVQTRLNAGIVPPLSAFLPIWFSPSQVPDRATLDRLPTLNQFRALEVRPFDKYGFAGSTLTTHLPIGDSQYNAGSFEIERRFSRGFQLNANYTWSKFIDDGTNEFFNSFMNPRRPQDWRNLANEKSVSVLDVPHRFVLVGTWDLPWLRGQKGLAGSVLGGWSVSGVYTAQSGQPFTAISLQNSVGNFDAAGQRAIVNPNATADTGTTASPVLNSAGQTVGYLAANSNAKYVQAREGSFPTTGRNTLRAPGLNNTDFTLAKNFRLSEEKSIKLESQFFNLFNHPQFTAANLLAVDPGLGQSYAFVGSAGFNDIRKAGGTGGARIIQLVVKFLF